RLRQLHDAQTAELGAIRLVRSPACRIVWMSGALELHSFLDMEPSIRMLERSQAEAVVFLGKVGVGLSAERLAAGQFAPYDRAFLVLDDEDAFDGDVTVLPETTCAAVCFRGSHPEAPAQYARLMDYLRAHALAPADFSREITMIDYGLTSDPENS
ncbi:transcriptional regulator of multidrug-efflux transporter, partial [human gut metagenome]